MILDTPIALYFENHDREEGWFKREPGISTFREAYVQFAGCSGTNENADLSQALVTASEGRPRIILATEGEWLATRGEGAPDEIFRGWEGEWSGWRLSNSTSLDSIDTGSEAEERVYEALGSRRIAAVMHGENGENVVIVDGKGRAFPLEHKHGTDGDLVCLIRAMVDDGDMPAELAEMVGEDALDAVSALTRSYGAILPGK